MRVVIIGGGFAGVAAAKKLYNQLSFEQEVEIILIDRNKHTTMLPSLPDVAGNRVSYRYLKEDIEKVIPRGVKFLNNEIDKVDFENKMIKMGEVELVYDYLIFAPGSKTNFYDFDETRLKDYKLDSLEDALRIRDNFYRMTNKNELTNVVISGAGYTGIELACNLYHFAQENKKKITITIIERSDRVLKTLKENISSYVTEKLSLLSIKIITNDEVKDFDGDKVTLKSGKVIDKAFFCWCSGVKIGITPKGKHNTIKDGRIIVDSFLRIPEHQEVFVVGDAAAIKYKDEYIRRAVNFSFKEGKNTGKNVAAILTDKKLKPYKPVDLGWVMPLYISSIGVGFGKEIRGRRGILFHYLMCGLKNYNGRNFRKYIKCGLKFSFTKVKQL